MLSLVNYGSSDESDDEDNHETGSDGQRKSVTQTGSTIPITDKDSEASKSRDDVDSTSTDESESLKVGAAPSNGNLEDNMKGDKKRSSVEDDLLSSLPPPVSDLRSIPWDQLSKLTYKSHAIRIMAPSIPDEVEEKKEKKLPSKTGSGLLAMLPSPKNQFVAQPKALRQATFKPKISMPKQKVLPKPKLLKLSEEHNSDSDGETEGHIDFFSLSACDIPLPCGSDVSAVIDIPFPKSETVIPPLPLSTESSSFFIDTSNKESDSSNQYGEDSTSYNSIPLQTNDHLELDNAALAALCGSRGLKRRAGSDEFKMIDINGSELTPDAQDILAKNLTADQPRPQRNSKDGPTSQQKRKHQIIYLAHQAKEQELELQNTWANNRMTKKQTQAKYGF